MLGIENYNYTIKNKKKSVKYNKASTIKNINANRMRHSQK